MKNVVLAIVLALLITGGTWYAVNRNTTGVEKATTFLNGQSQ